MALDKTYEPSKIEKRWYEHWETSGAFKPSGDANSDPYTIVIPPPNVTGSLHMGHALDNTLQDILIRFERLRGKDVLWQVGCDHAGIATQMVVERQLDEKGIKRRDIGRDAFLERVWAWKEESGSTIMSQLRRLGASCDWDRERFTMDDGFSHAVLKVFVELFEEGLIYRDKRLVNWDPKLLTAISDLEVEAREIEGHFWHFRYPIVGEKDRCLVVATTRPETMLGDSGVAVHPDDDRYKDLIGKFVELPLVGRHIPIVADEYADMEQGTGAVKMTPAHDFNDFEVGKRQNLELINIFDQHACINENAPEKYRGLDRFAARELIVADMDALGLLEKVEPHSHTVPYGDRGGVVIEPWLTDQWYVDAAVLAKPAIEAVKSGKTQFIPKNWEKTYFEWMNNIQPWCISRQLWWGHRIPAWYGPDGSVFVAINEDEAQTKARAHFGETVALKQDEDVLDTWFSSALWPFGTLGWPDETDALNRYYPNSTLVTGFDIIFFWVARMMMMGLHFKKEVPFKNVYIHALVRDEKGAKMSKSKGNVIDPLEFIDSYGADALRFTLAAMEAQGRDIKLSESRVEGYRNFGTKLWNAARFAEMNGCFDNRDDGFDPDSVENVINRWIISETRAAASSVTQALEAFRFNDAADAIYHFSWGTFCDWYVELVKPILQGEDASAKREVQITCAWVLDQILILLHPMMPFISEELWHATGVRDCDLIHATWPDLSQDKGDQSAQDDVRWLINAVTSVRSVRAELNVPASAKVDAIITGASDETVKRFDIFASLIERLARINNISTTKAPPTGGVAQVVLGESVMHIPLEGVMDISEEKKRLESALDKAAAAITGLEKRLGNEQFLAKAKPEAVEKARSDLEAEILTRDKLSAALKRLG